MATPKYSIDTSPLDNAKGFDFQPMTSADLEESLGVLRQSFFPLELIHSALRATDNPASIVELEKLCRITAQDGVSVIAKDKASGKIVSVAFCKIQIKPEPGKPGAFDEIAATFREPEALAVMNFMMVVDGKVDMYAKYNTNTLFELMFLGTLPEFCGRRIAKDVCRACLQVASQIPDAGGVNILCTSPWSERISASLGFHLLHQDNYSEFLTPDGVKLSDLVGVDKVYTLRVYPLVQHSTSNSGKHP